MKLHRTLRFTAFLAALATLPAFSGCSHFAYETKAPEEQKRLDIGLALLPPTENATDDENAGRAVSELLGTALFERGVPLAQTESLRLKIGAPKAAGADGGYDAQVKASGATHLILSTVHEYRYKTDLDGDPAVGLTVRIVDAKTGVTVWQGSAGNVGYVFASLSSSAQSTVRRLVARIPLADKKADDSAYAEAPKEEARPEGTTAAAPVPVKVGEAPAR